MSNKINTELLLRLVSEFQAALGEADKVKDSKEKYIVEISKALGLVSSVSQEASFLALDCKQLIKNQSMPDLKADGVNTTILEMFDLKDNKDGGVN